MDANTPTYDHVPCPLCRTPKPEELYSSRRFTGSAIGAVEVHVSQCRECGFAFNSPRLSDESLRRYYADDASASGGVYRSEDAESYYPRLYARRAEFYAPFLARRDAGRFLDVGCGGGGFLKSMRERLPADWQLFGLEPSAQQRAPSAESGFEVRRGALGDPVFPDASFDAISMISVMEHLTDPAQAMDEIARLLAPGGLVLLEVPNTLHPELSLNGFFGLEHICHFSPGSVGRLLARANQSEVRVDESALQNVVRVVSGSQLAGWGVDNPGQFGDDREDVARAIRDYAVLEEQLIRGLEERVGTALERWSAEGRTVAIYGAGAHTAELSTRFDLAKHASFLVDGNTAKHGTKFLGLEVLAPEALVERNVDAVLLSSHRFVDEMEATVRRLAGSRVEIQRCYEA